MLGAPHLLDAHPDPAGHQVGHTEPFHPEHQGLCLAWSGSCKKGWDLWLVVLSVQCWGPLARAWPHALPHSSWGWAATSSSPPCRRAKLIAGNKPVSFPRPSSCSSSSKQGQATQVRPEAHAGLGYSLPHAPILTAGYWPSAHQPLSLCTGAHPDSPLASHSSREQPPAL